MPDYPRRSRPERQLPLTVPVFQILLSLTDQDLHGYAIIQDIRARTGGEVSLTASTLYAAIARLVGTGLIEELDTRPGAEEDDPRRRYYAITPKGRQVARLEMGRLQRLLQSARPKRLTPRKA